MDYINNPELYDDESSEGEEGDEYEVEKILGHRGKRSDRDNLLLLVKWKGYDSSDNTWEPLDNLTNCNDKISEYWDNVDKSGPPSDHPQKARPMASATVHASPSASGLGESSSSGYSKSHTSWSASAKSGSQLIHAPPVKNKKTIPLDRIPSPAGGSGKSALHGQSFKPSSSKSKPASVKRRLAEKVKLGVNERSQYASRYVEPDPDRLKKIKKRKNSGDSGTYSVDRNRDISVGGKTTPSSGTSGASSVMDSQAKREKELHDSVREISKKLKQSANQGQSVDPRPPKLITGTSPGKSNFVPTDPVHHRPGPSSSGVNLSDQLKLNKHSKQSSGVGPVDPTSYKKTTKDQGMTASSTSQKVVKKSKPDGHGSRDQSHSSVNKSKITIGPKLGSSVRPISKSSASDASFQLNKSVKDKAAKMFSNSKLKTKPASVSPSGSTQSHSRSPSKDSSLGTEEPPGNCLVFSDSDSASTCSSVMGRTSGAVSPAIGDVISEEIDAGGGLAIATKDANKSARNSTSSNPAKIATTSGQDLERRESNPAFYSASPSAASSNDSSIFDYGNPRSRSTGENIPADDSENQEPALEEAGVQPTFRNLLAKLTGMIDASRRTQYPAIAPMRNEQSYMIPIDDIADPTEYLPFSLDGQGIAITLLEKELDDPAALSDQDFFEYACFKGDIDLVRQIHAEKKRSINVNATSKTGTTLLMKICAFACDNSHKYCKLMEMMITDFGADPRAKTISHFTALMIVAEQGFYCKMKPCLLQKSIINQVAVECTMRLSALGYAIKNNNVACVSRLLYSGADFSLEQEYRMVTYTPVLLARELHTASSTVFKITNRFLQNCQLQFERMLDENFSSLMTRVHDIIPLHFVNPNDSTECTVRFKLHKIPRAHGRCGDVLFISPTLISDEEDFINCAMTVTPCPILDVTLNGKRLSSLLEDESLYVCTFQPVYDGDNTLTIKFVHMLESPMKILFQPFVTTVPEQLVAHNSGQQDSPIQLDG